MRTRILLLPLLACSCFGASVTTAQSNNARTSSVTDEKSLTIAAVSSTHFRKLGQFDTGEKLFAQPLYIQGATISGVKRNVVIIATMHNSLIAYNADIPGGTTPAVPLWSRSFGGTLTSYPAGNDPNLYGLEIGCLSTPVVDETNGWVFAACAGPASGASASWILYKVSLSTGAILSQVTISGSVVGTGDPTSTPDSTTGPNLNFFAQYCIQRPPLLLSQGNVYVSFAAYADTHPYHGWVIAYSASTLSQTGIICFSPNSYGGGIWQAGGGPAADAAGNVYVMTGNGLYDGVTNFSDSFVKLPANLSAVSDWLTPSNVVHLDNNDLDLGSGHPMIIESISQIIGGSKDYRVWAAATGNMGHLQGTGAAPQVWYTNSVATPANDSGIYGGMVMNSKAFFPNVDGKIYGFSRSGSTWNTTPWLTSSTFPFPGANLTGSANGTSDEIVWAVTSALSEVTAPHAGTLRAFKASDLTQIYSSDAIAVDVLGNAVKFASPTVANGRVYVSEQSGLVVVYGLVNTGGLTGKASVTGKSGLN